MVEFKTYVQMAIEKIGGKPGQILTSYLERADRIHKELIENIRKGTKELYLNRLIQDGTLEKLIEDTKEIAGLLGLKDTNWYKTFTQVAKSYNLTKTPENAYQLIEDMEVLLTALVEATIPKELGVTTCKELDVKEIRRKLMYDLKAIEPESLKERVTSFLYDIYKKIFMK